MQYVTAKEIAEALGVSRQAIQKRAQREGWPYIEEQKPNGGKPVKKYFVSTLPEDIKLALCKGTNATC